MSALVKACNVAASIKNTGIECSAAMGATAMIIAVPAGLKWTTGDLADFVGYISEQSHAAASARVYPLFGNNAPIRIIGNNDEDDVTETYDDGFINFVRSGFANRTFTTDKGGLCYAKALRSFLNAGYSFIEVDKSGQVIMKLNEDGTYSGFAANLGGKTPTGADFKSTYKNRFQLSYDPTTYINQGEIFTGAEGLLDLMGLIDFEISSAAAATTTKLKIAVTSDCAETDLVVLLGADLAQITNFVVTKVSDGSAVSISAAAIVSGHIELTGTFTTATAYNVAAAAASVLFTNGVEGYEMKSGGDVAITIP